MSKAGVEMKDMGQAAAAAAPVAAANAVPGYTRAQHIQALQPLNQAIANLGAARGNLDSLAADAKGIHPKLHPNFWKQGNKKHHRRAIDKIDDMDSFAYNKLENGLSGITTDLKNAHRDIPTAIDAVRTAHENLLRQHPALAGKSGKRGAQTRTFISPTGVQVSLGNYHGKKHTHPGDGSIVKGVSRGEDYGPSVPHHRLFGGRKTHKHRRKHRRKHKRKTRKHKRKHKTKKRKHHRRKHKRKTRRR